MTVWCVTVLHAVNPRESREFAVELGHLDSLTDAELELAAYELARTSGYQLVQQVASLRGVYLYREPPGHRLLKRAGEFFNPLSMFYALDVRWVEEQVPKRRFKRELRFEDPLFGQQWHLHGPSSINVSGVWEQGN